jgi:acetoin utilization deacetylase AcuC-like enzyme
MKGKEQMPNSGERIGLVYHPDYLVHNQEHHPERKERLEQILSTLEAHPLENKIKKITPLPAELGTVALVHDPGYIESIDEACRQGRRFLDMDTYIVSRSYEVALLAAGGAVAGLKEVLEGECRKVFALTRPPGHHAERNRAMGFCIFNHAAVAARSACRDYGLERVAVIDWDVHHGNGTQHIFEADPHVLYLSLHQSPAYPGTGQLRETGCGAGEGYTINIPLPAGSGDADYLLFFERVILPVLERFKPDLLVISAGQDAYYRDPLAGMSLTHSGYYRMAEALSKTASACCSGRMLLCLEGGYHLQGQAGAVLQVLNAIGRWGLPVPEENPPREPAPATLRRLEEVLQVQSQYWPLRGEK